jgi:translation initiation factor IF-3
MSLRNSAFSNSFTRVNGKIRAREVRVIGTEGQQLGVFSLQEAINMARANGVDLVEIAAAANPPVCRLVDYGKFRYEQAKKDKEAKKHQHANKVKEIQLSPQIDPHDFGVKLSHAIEFLCEEMKVKVTLKFRGREMAHKEYGHQVIDKFVNTVAPYGHPDAPPKLIGKGINVMLSPLPRTKRAKPPEKGESIPVAANGDVTTGQLSATQSQGGDRRGVRPGGEPKPSTPVFTNNPFANLNVAADENG